MTPFDILFRTRVVFGRGAVLRAGELARSLDLRRVLLVADPGLHDPGHVSRVQDVLRSAGLEVCLFDRVRPDPDADDVERGRLAAAGLRPDGLVALGGGSAMDTAKGINFLVTNGGRMADYRGYGRTRTPLLPMIAIPTTGGTGSDAQSYAVITDPASGLKMACGDPGAAFRIAVLDPDLTVSAPREVTATAGFDAISHAVETWVTTRRTAISTMCARESWTLLAPAYPEVLERPDDVEARAAMLIGAHLAGLAIEGSMLGAAHACANPLTARFRLSHGAAVALMLPAVVEWNAADAGIAARYAQLARWADLGDGVAALTARLRDLRAQAGLPESLKEIGVRPADLPDLARLAAGQWTGTFNPRPFDESGALELYRRTLGA